MPGEYSNYLLPSDTATHILLLQFAPESLSILLLSLFKCSFLIIKLTSSGEMVLGLTQIVCTLARLVGGKVNVKSHAITLFA